MREYCHRLVHFPVDLQNLITASSIACRKPALLSTPIRIPSENKATK